MKSATGAACGLSLIILLHWAVSAAGAEPPAAEPDGPSMKLRGTPDPDATGGEAKTLDRDGIYCWWDGPPLKPGYFEVTARARAAGHPGVLHFVLCRSGQDAPPMHAVSLQQQGVVQTGPYREVYCGTFYWDGTYTPRLSDWSTGGLFVDWVRLLPVTMATMRDPDPGKVRRVLAPRFPEPPTIDADLSEWARVPALSLGPESARGTRYGGSADLGALCRWAWDDKALYFAAQVQDDKAIFLPDARDLGNLWQFDCIQMAFDAAGNARGPGYADDDYEYGFGLAGNVPKAYRWATGNNLPLGDVPNVTVRMRRDDNRQTTSYEARIPWTELLPFSPATRSCGMTLVVADNDGDGPQSSRLEWTPGIAGPKDPSAFGMLTLIDEAPAAAEITAWLVGSRDLSDQDEATFTLDVQAPEPLGAATARWRLVSGESERARGEMSADLADPSTRVPLVLDLRRAGSGNFRLEVSLCRGEQVIATAHSDFARYDVAALTERLTALRARYQAEWVRAQALREGGLQAGYPRATLGVVAEFLTHCETDIGERVCDRAEAAMGDLARMLDEATIELDALVADPASDRPVPALGRQRLAVRDGAFWDGDRPVFLIGFCGWWQVWTECQRLADIGMNHAEDSIIAPFALLPERTGISAQNMLDAADWAWLRGDEGNFRYSRMIACNQFPAWFAGEHPEATGGGWGGVSTLSPAVRDLAGSYLDTLSAITARHYSPAVQVLYGENTHTLTRHPLEVSAFHDWLLRKYGSLEAINSAWGTTYAAVGEVGNGDQAAGPVAWYDRGIFNQKLFTDWTTWLVQRAHGKDPALLCTGYPSLLSWDDSSDFSTGIDMEALCRTFDVNGCDTAALDYGGERWAMSSIAGFAMLQDLLQAFNPDHPNYDPELHLTNLKQPYPAAYVRAALWQGFFHGLSAASCWVYQRSEGIDSMLTYQPRVMEEYLRTGLDLRRLVEPVRAFQRAPASAALLYSLTSVAYNPKHLPELRAAYEGTFFLDTKVGFVTERTVREGALARHRLLVLPEVSHVPQDVADRIGDWVRTGGWLWVIGSGVERDEADRRLPVVAELQQGELGGTGVLMARLGEGMIVRTPSGADAETTRRLGDILLTEAGVGRPLRVVGTDGEAVDGVEFRTVAASDRRLVYLINMNKAPVEVQLAGASNSALHDLRTGRELSLPIVLQPLEVILGES